jgi:hypothetical protein
MGFETNAKITDYFEYVNCNIKKELLKFLQLVNG